MSLQTLLQPFVFVTFLFVSCFSQAWGEENLVPQASPLKDMLVPEKDEFGVSAVYLWQDRELAVTGFNITGITPLGPLNPNSLRQLRGVGGSGLFSQIKNESETMAGRIDHWIFPFLNVFGTLGQVEGEVDIAMASGLGPNRSLSYEGMVYGGGLNAVVGWKGMFLLNRVTYSITDLDLGGSVRSLVWSPKLGVRKGKLAAWVGAVYVDSQREQSRRLILQNAPLAIDFDIALEEKNPWNYGVGARWHFDEKWSLGGEMGFGDRRHVILALRRGF